MINVIGGTVYPEVPTSFIFLLFFWLSHVAGRTSVPQPGIEPMPSGVEAANSFFFFFLISLATLSLHCFARASSGDREQGLLFIAAFRLLSAVAPLVAEHGL